jgi:hypothetical protein
MLWQKNAKGPPDGTELVISTLPEPKMGGKHFLTFDRSCLNHVGRMTDAGFVRRMTALVRASE